MSGGLDACGYDSKMPEMLGNGWPDFKVESSGLLCSRDSRSIPKGGGSLNYTVQVTNTFHSLEEHWGRAYIHAVKCMALKSRGRFRQLSFCTIHSLLSFSAFLLCLDMVGLIFFHGHNDIGDQDDICHDCCKCASICGIACTKVSHAGIVDERSRKGKLSLPPKTALTERKYDPIGTQNMARVKPSNLYMTGLSSIRSLDRSFTPIKGFPRTCHLRRNSWCGIRDLISCRCTALCLGDGLLRLNITLSCCHSVFHFSLTVWLQPALHL